MTVEVTFGADQTSGLSYPSVYNAFLSDFVAAGYPYMEVSTQIVALGELDGADTQIFIINGDDFEYDLATHTVSGSIDEIIIGTLGDSYNADGSFDVDADDEIVGYDTIVRYDGLDLTNAVGVKGDVNELVAEILYLNSGENRGTEMLDSTLNGQAQVVMDTTGNDTYFGTRFDDEFFGTEGRDVAVGGNGDDYLYGGDGVDVLVGSLGDDTLDGAGDNDKLRGRWGDDVLIGGEGDDQIFGNADDDSVRGGSGNDVLIGGVGADSLDSGAGRDVFLYRTADEPDGDIIYALDDENDIISLRPIDANVNTAAKDSFVIVDAFSGAAGELQVTEASGNTVVAGDLTGNGEADFTFTIWNQTDVPDGVFLL
ncbi:calcium-binding protein [Acuticoccus sp. I52.16.1]|uniref:calcium-binding protein n=1 Tax=Acuticoccus sp. I52.16.1 TaxID=2928472 RepID=UPI001FD1F78B|nr:calcium-binding protein [Acuticoccus sp. I52.16.1]UOM33917.1 hypothetical protein MRB58_19075 [Acuticoccus sp. I52.16.1]